MYNDAQLTYDWLHALSMSRTDGWTDGKSIDLPTQSPKHNILRTIRLLFWLLQKSSGRKNYSENKPKFQCHKHEPFKLLLIIYYYLLPIDYLLLFDMGPGNSFHKSYLTRDLFSQCNDNLCASMY